MARERRWITDFIATTLSFLSLGGMVQSWNKFCFTGGYLVASIRLPGRNGESHIALLIRTSQADRLFLSALSISTDPILSLLKMYRVYGESHIAEEALFVLPDQANRCSLSIFFLDLFSRPAFWSMGNLGRVSRIQEAEKS